jgi:hypothetical protein
MHGFYVGVRGTCEDLHESKVFFSDKASTFVKEVLNMEPRHLALKFEAWVISGLVGMLDGCRVVGLADVSVEHGCGLTRGFGATGRTGTGTGPDLETRAKTVPVTVGSYADMGLSDLWEADLSQCSTSVSARLTPSLQPHPPARVSSTRCGHMVSPTLYRCYVQY